MGGVGGRDSLTSPCRLDGKLEEILLRSSVPKNIAASVAGFCRGKIAISVDAEDEDASDFLSMV